MSEDEVPPSLWHHPSSIAMNTSPEFTFDETSFDIEDSGDLLGLARSLINGQHPGILATTDASGQPQMRWMSTLSFGDFPVFHTLTAANARKVDQIRNNPRVSWMFFNKDLSLTLHLSGQASIIDDPATLKHIWRSVEDKTHTYFLNEYSHRPGFVAIETTVESIECSSPASGLRVEVPASDLCLESATPMRATT
jgi:general stress protein 26